MINVRMNVVVSIGTFNFRLEFNFIFVCIFWSNYFRHFHFGLTKCSFYWLSISLSLSFSQTIFCHFELSFTFLCRFVHFHTSYIHSSWLLSHNFSLTWFLFSFLLFQLVSFYPFSDSILRCLFVSHRISVEVKFTHNIFRHFRLCLCSFSTFFVFVLLLSFIIIYLVRSIVVVSKCKRCSNILYIYTYILLSVRFEHNARCLAANRKWPTENYNRENLAVSSFPSLFFVFVTFVCHSSLWRSPTISIGLNRHFHLTQLLVDAFIHLFVYARYRTVTNDPTSRLFCNGVPTVLQSSYAATQNNHNNNNHYYHEMDRWCDVHVGRVRQTCVVV